ncbi:MAG: hypothetical protein ACM3QS_16995 [Bacteroidota bacterium]
MNKLLKIVLALIGLALLAACGTLAVLAKSDRVSSAHPMFQPGDRIRDMTLTTGAEQAYQLWSFCSAPVQKENVTSVDCGVPAISRLAIGYPFGIPDKQQEGSDLDWELTLDGRPVDLHAFGTQVLVFPAMTARPSPIREVFRRVKIWDVVLENPTPGLHTVRGSLRVNDQPYLWNVDLSVAAQGG